MSQILDDPEFKRGCRLFNEGDYFEAHEVWEELWVPASGEERYFLQGLIQIAAALHHAGNQNWNGTRKLLGSGFGYLQKGQSQCPAEVFEFLKDSVVEVELAVQKRVAGEEAPIPFFQLPFDSST